MSEPKSSGIQAEALQSLLDPLLDLLADKIVERMNGSKPAVAAEKDTLLTPEQAAAIIGVDKNWLYRHSKQLPFTRRLSRKKIRFNEAGLRRWMAARK